MHFVFKMTLSMLKSAIYESQIWVTSLYVQNMANRAFQIAPFGIAPYPNGVQLPLGMVNFKGSVRHNTANMFVETYWISRD